MHSQLAMTRLVHCILPVSGLLLEWITVGQMLAEEAVNVEVAERHFLWRTSSPSMLPMQPLALST